MKKLKSIILLLCCFVLLTGFISPVQLNEPIKNFPIYPIDELENFPYEKTVSLEEVIKSLKSINASSKEIEQLINDNAKNYSRGTEVRYATFYMTTYKQSYGLWSTCHYQARFTVGLNYTIGADSPNYIVNIGAPHIYTGGGDACVFKGTIDYRINNGASFYYTFYGDLYVEGNVNWAVGATIGIGKSSSVNFTLTNGSGYITNVSKNETYRSSGLMP